MTDQWQELKDTITEMRDNEGTGTQQEVCEFLANYMEILEKQMQEPCEMTAEEYRQRMIQAFHNANTDELIALCVLPTEKEFEHLEWLLKTHYKKAPYDDAISRQDALRAFMYATNGERLPDYDCDNYPVTYDLRYIKKTLRALPPVTPQPKTGHWMIDEDSTDRFFATYECSCCKRAIIVPHDVMKAVYKDYPFCHCGAKMVESQERSE